jgi:flagellar biosynthesis GTPase FlhF
MANKVFTGSSVADAMERVKIEMGDDVSILDIRHVRKGEVEVVVGFIASSEGEGKTAVGPISGDERTLASKVVREVSTRHAGVEQANDDSAESTLRYLLLERAGIGKDFSDVIIKNWSGTQGSFSERLAAILSHAINVHKEISFNNRFVAIMGSCGSGKSSVAFKLAHQLSACCGIRCGVLHLDAGKRSVYEHAPEGLVVPIVSFALSECFPATLGRALSEFAECDLVFIDLPSSTVEGNDESSSQCARLMSLLKSVEVLVTVDARLQRGVIKKVLSRAKTYGDVRAVISRVDDAGSLAVSLSCLYEEGIPLAFLSTGPQIPDNIEPASLARVAWMVAKQLLDAGIDTHRISRVSESGGDKASSVMKGGPGVAPVAFAEFV